MSVGLVLCAISALLLWRAGGALAAIVGVIGLVLLVCGLVYAPVLRRPSAAWWRFSRMLGLVNTRILLGIVFLLVLTPLSMLWRLLGKDPLARRRDRWPGWTPYPARYRDRKHYLRMY